MDVLLWILTGLGAGLAVATLLPRMRLHSMSELGWRRVRNMAVGMLGAVAAGYGLPTTAVSFAPSHSIAIVPPDGVNFTALDTRLEKVLL